MTSALPMIGVRLDPQVYERVRQAAQEDGRSLSNYVAQILARAHPPTGVPLPPPGGRQVDLEELIAAPGPSAEVSAPARRPSQNGPCTCGSGLKYKRCCGRAK